MNIFFNIDYSTGFGEEIVLNIIDSGQKGKAGGAQYRMQTADGHTWTCCLHLDNKVGTAVDYSYSVERGDTVLRREWQVVPHRLELNSVACTDYMVYDHWTDMPLDSFLYSSAFTECVSRRRLSITPINSAGAVVRLKVRAPQVRSGERLVLTGSSAALGEWCVSKGIFMYEHQSGEWVADVDAARLRGDRLEFKFVIADAKGGSAVAWETSDNRVVELLPVREGRVVVYELYEAVFDIPPVRCAGTLIPVFSLRSRTSFGVGDFGDLRKMIDWVAATGQRVLQVLPINDTTMDHTWADSYPYNCISVFALHPQYVDLTALPRLADEEAAAAFESLRQELNALPQLDYERVNRAKDSYMRMLFGQEGARMMEGGEFRKFFKEAGQWLVPYAQYCYLRDTNGTADFSRWQGHETFREEDRKALSSPRSKAYKDVAYYYFVQFILYTQMRAVHGYARSRGVILKGDIPIGVNRQGCDVWQEPRYFNLDGQAGAPPDDFSVNGQNWGFPTYNWQEMMKDGCAWWVRRFRNMAGLFDAYRIDHVLGFFRIWEIPSGAVHGLLGQFSPALGLSREEIEAYGLHFEEELFTIPFITGGVLADVFGDAAGKVRDGYLVETGGGRYALRPEYSEQRKVEAAFAGKDGAEDIRLRDGLYSLISNVLFVRDRRDKDKFHPRISAQWDSLYKSLPEEKKNAFDRLYNDYYYRRNSQFWYREAMKKLPRLVQSTRMLVCAEDLGMVPECVAWVMDELRILSLELQSMPKEYGVRFGDLSKNPYRSVCTISSHDTPTLRMWWDEDPERTQDYWNRVLGRGGEAPHPLPAWLAREIVCNHLACPSMLCVIALQDWLAVDGSLRLPDASAERINIPANPRHYWRYRMHLCIEDLLDSGEYNANIADIISQAGRS